MTTRGRHPERAAAETNALIILALPFVLILSERFYGAWALVLGLVTGLILHASAVLVLKVSRPAG